MSGKTILIVDDSPSMRQMLQAVLSSAGYKVVEANDGQHALDRLGGAKVDVVITDLNMPVMDGLTFTKKLRSTAGFKFTPILILTTEVSPARKQEAKGAGATGWLVKPFDPVQLVSVVQRVAA